MWVWSVQDAKARLSEIMRRVRAGEPHAIGARDPCVIVRAEDWRGRSPVTHFGRALLDIAPHDGNRAP